MLLNWTVDKEVNMHGYQLERSGDGNRFSVIGQQPANHSGSYQLLDKAAPNSNLYYRLQLQEKDGSSSYSQTVMVKPISKGFEASIQHNGWLKLEAAKAGKLMMQLFTAEGKLLDRMEKQLQAGSNQLLLPLLQLSKGVYWLHLQLDGEKQVVKMLR